MFYCFIKSCLRCVLPLEASINGPMKKTLGCFNAIILCLSTFKLIFKIAFKNNFPWYLIYPSNIYNCVVEIWNCLKTKAEKSNKYVSSFWTVKILISCTSNTFLILYTHFFLFSDSFSYHKTSMKDTCVDLFLSPVRIHQNQAALQSTWFQQS